MKRCSECIYEKLCIIRRELAETINRTRSNTSADSFAEVCRDFKEDEDDN